MASGKGSGKRRSKKEVCQARKNFRNNTKKPCKVCDKCKDDPEKCTLYPYRPNCCGDKKPKMTGHHVIAGNCFALADGTPVPGATGYNYNDAPCICVVGGGKVKTHGKLHKTFDTIQADYKNSEHPDFKEPGVWTYEEARQAGVDSVTQHFKQCSKECIQAQLDEYHLNEAKIPPRGKPLRADPTKAKPAKILIHKTKTGGNG